MLKKGTLQTNWDEQLLPHLSLKHRYRTGRDDLFNDFYLPTLKCANSYDRAVGYFSSKLLAASAQGLTNLIRSEGRMRLIIGDVLTSEEFDSIYNGRELDTLFDDLNKRLLDTIEQSDGSTRYRLELLALMIASKRLEIRFAFRTPGIYHDKIGIFTDKEGNKVAFTGSANETSSAMDVEINGESITVFRSWDERVFNDYGLTIIEDFENVWDGKMENTYTIDVPSSFYQRFIDVLPNATNLDFDLESKMVAQEIARELGEKSTHSPFIPENLNSRPFHIFEHQRTALRKWMENSYRGILKLATGSGKTITAIYGAVKIYEKRKRLCLVVSVPYIDLANQWVRNLSDFGIYPHKCYQSKSQWISSLKTATIAFNAGASQFLAIVVVNKTLISNDFLSIINNIDLDSMLFIGDECHNHGSLNISKVLPDCYFRMGLSATPFRSNEDEYDSPFPDDSKTRIINYYGEVVDDYSLSKAINTGILTEYNYTIIPVHLTEEEQGIYETLTSQIGKLISRQKTMGPSTNDQLSLTFLCGQRSRLLGSAENKYNELFNLVKNVPDKNKRHTLFYCGEGNREDQEGNSERVINLVSRKLSEAGWRTSQFTSQETKQERIKIMDGFKRGYIDGLVSIRVLDEGIDVPVCTTAYILASTKNPRQYVQRRGRILRKAEGKDMSYIFDFVVLPAHGSESTASMSLMKSEYKRVYDFTLLAANKYEVEQKIEEIGFKL